MRDGGAERRPGAGSIDRSRNFRIHFALGDSDSVRLPFREQKLDRVTLDRERSYVNMLAEGELLRALRQDDCDVSCAGILRSRFVGFLQGGAVASTYTVGHCAAFSFKFSAPVNFRWVRKISMFRQFCRNDRP